MEWSTIHEAWDAFVSQHPELGYNPGFFQLHNFLRHHRAPLVRADAIRKVKGKHWIAHRERFPQIAFDAATGHLAALA
ncbi:hypothetical protein EZ313_19620 [Ramlibacter henchirensis]|uniref:Uncharacterized protein n=1 Tax=Ramlibacter henchirensis TaxID=204072 RepID=A0A4Z0BPH3_9BURK|nr:hypothetical protein [Ramlibacter henchirensis]TFZ00662.1 hypothetical protein EZ313_19620 [Ramlibacter henchirensis]